MWILTSIAINMLLLMTTRLIMAATQTNERYVLPPTGVKQDLVAEGSGQLGYGSPLSTSLSQLGGHLGSPLGQLGSHLGSPLGQLSGHLGPSLGQLASQLGQLAPYLSQAGPPYAPPPPVNPLLSALLMLTNPAAMLGYGGGTNMAAYSNPMLQLLLSQYGKYLPYGLGSYGLYGYSAPNSVQNAKAFAPYKHEDRT